ncbi:GGDEF domain-containing protein [Pseudoduganella umbonata]|nr:GGDEF domain-containing protein [Pseudoduganella umbonata]MBB3219994.1 diguanylate cyclase (GGDEF)-like protein/PAS domain S-box-containing protein [Pseudoduganella umbonata]
METINRLRRSLARWILPVDPGTATGQGTVSDSERGFRAITDNISGIIIQFDAQGRILFANAMVTARLGRSNEQLLGHHLRDVAPPEVFALVERYFERALTGEQVAFEVAFPVKGVHTHFSGSYVPEFDAAGKLLSVYALWLDITERKQVELRHAAGERRWLTIADNLPALIAYVDSDLRFEFCNATFSTWTGLQPAELLGRSILDVIVAAGPRRAEAIRHNLQRGLNGERVEFELGPDPEYDTDPAKAKRWLQVTIVPQVGEGGMVEGIHLLSSDVSSLKQVQQTLAGLARFDELTGLPNRYHLNEKLADATRRNSRSGLPMGVIFLDIDHFKQINDTLGHGVGDSVLREFGRRLSGCVRECDTVARLGGDEFLIVLENIGDSSTLETVGAKILEGLTPPFALPGGPLQVSSSIGLAFAAGPGIVPMDLLECADVALYDAKRAGRATYRLNRYAGGAAPALQANC